MSNMESLVGIFEDAKQVLMIAVVIAIISFLLSREPFSILGIFGGGIVFCPIGLLIWGKGGAVKMALLYGFFTALVHGACAVGVIPHLVFWGIICVSSSSSGEYEEDDDEDKDEDEDEDDWL